MKKLIALAAGCCIAFTPGCKKNKQHEPETPEPTQVATYANYSQLKVGNYWIYERYKIDPTMNNDTIYLHQNDSCYVEKDTLIRNNTYLKIRKYDFIFQNSVALFYRDSLHYIIDAGGHVVFSSQDFTTVFNIRYSTSTNPSSTHPDTLFRSSQKMMDKDLVVHVPAGTFKTSNMQTSILFSSLVVTPGPYLSSLRLMEMRYAENTGVVLETEAGFSGVPGKTERRLIRYHLN